MPDLTGILWLFVMSCPLVGFAFPLPSAPPPTEEPAATVIRLPAPLSTGHVLVEESLKRRRSVRTFLPTPPTLTEVGQLLWAAQGITGPEGERTAPSAGALYPLEVYLLVGRVAGLAPGIYHYRPGTHDLVHLVEGDRRADLAATAYGQNWLQEAPACLVFTAFPRRTAGKYGGRAPRYVHMETGAAAENASLQAVALGLGSVFVGAFDDAAVRRILLLAHDEEPFLILPFGRTRK